jgi:hypothetical protein
MQTKKATVANAQTDRKSQAQPISLKSADQEKDSRLE